MLDLQKPLKPFGHTLTSFDPLWAKMSTPWLPWTRVTPFWKPGNQIDLHSGEHPRKESQWLDLLITTKTNLDQWLRWLIFLSWHKAIHNGIPKFPISSDQYWNRDKVYSIFSQTCISIRCLFSKYPFPFSSGILARQCCCCFRAKILHLPCDGLDCYQGAQMQS